MKRIIGIKFSHYGQIYFFYCEDPFVGRGDRVLAETGQGLGIATVMNIVDRLPEDLPPDGVRDILRKVTDEDQIVAEENDTLTYSAYKFCESRIRERQLDMKLVDVEVLFDRSKLVFYFTAPTRIDFRELVKDLVREYHTRIELRQIGVRDEAKMIGGLGCCGRELCCSSYLDDFHPVSINMAKDQNLSLNPAKISGVCGRLMCCLKYEHEAYAELQKVTPRQGSVVDTPEGRGKVVSTQMLRGTCKVQLDDSPEHSLTEFQCTQCCMVKGACRNRQNAAAMAEERRKREEQEDAAAPAPKKDAPKKSEAPHQKPQQPRPPRKPAPQQTAADELPEDAQNELSPDGEGAPRRRRRRGGRRRRKPNGENGAPEQNSGEE